MGGTFTSWGALQEAMLQEVVSAVSDATDKVKDELQENVDYFYTAPEGRYKRTGQLQQSVMNDGVTATGNGAVGQVSINTGTQYDPAGRDTETIYGYAENDGLLGYGGFWRATEAVAQEILDSEIAKRFG